MIALPLVVLPVSTDAFTVQQIMPKCQKAQGENFDIDATFCLGMVSGIGHLANQNCASAKGDWVPYPDYAADTKNVPLGAWVQTFLNWAQEHPENWGWQAEEGIIMSLSEKFPCLSE